MKTADYRLTIRVELAHMRPPADITERVERDQVQTQIDAAVDRWLAEGANRETLMNTILGNTGILVPQQTGV